jgi:hypothetical protein
MLSSTPATITPSNKSPKTIPLRIGAIIAFCFDSTGGWRLSGGKSYESSHVFQSKGQGTSTNNCLD